MKTLEVTRRLAANAASIAQAIHAAAPDALRARTEGLAARAAEAWLATLTATDTHTAGQHARVAVTTAAEADKLARAEGDEAMREQADFLRSSAALFQS